MGRPRNRKTKIGKLNPSTGEAIYTPEYLERNPGLRVAQLPVSENTIFKAGAYITQVLDSVKDFGVFWFLRWTAEKSGLLDVLQQVFPFMWQEIFTLACYLVASDKPVMYCEDWISKNEWINVRSMSSQRISELLSRFGEVERNNFYRQWCKYISENECIALDITSVSSYSNQISDCEWGHNRDNEKLPQINLCMLFGEKSRLPIYQTGYSGSLGDVTTLETTMNEFCTMTGGREIVIVIVMDKGFFSKRNVDMLIEKRVHFLISVPFTSAFAKHQIISERKDIDQVSKVIRTSHAPVRGIHKIRAWGKDGIKLHTHIYFNPEKALHDRNNLFNDISRLRKIAETDPDNKEHAESIKRYFVVRKSTKANFGYTVSIKEDAVVKSLENAGWFVLISNHIDNAQDAYDKYRMKDVVEKGFWKYKNNLGLDRLRVHGDARMRNKTFIAFIALILSSYVHNTMKAKELYRLMTFDKLFLILAKLKSATVDGQRFLRPLTKQQKNLFKAFDMPLPDSPVYVG
jgi:transposase